MQDDKDQYHFTIPNLIKKDLMQPQEEQRWMPNRQRPGPKQRQGATCRAAPKMQKPTADSERRPRRERCRKQEIATEAGSSRQLPPRRRVTADRRNCTLPHLQQNLKPKSKFRATTEQAQDQSKDRATG